jgi:putative SOS response-associated peptidase YedK
MCGRFTLTASGEELAEALGLDEAPEPAAPRFNIAPSQPILAVRLVGRKRQCERLLWGLNVDVGRGEVDPDPVLPGFGPRSGPSEGRLVINVRSETAATRAPFREAFAARRCLIPADGFYEWRQSDPLRQPYRIHRPDGRPFAFAGLWQPASPSSTEGAGTCAILTTRPNGVVSAIHDRMPVILAAALFERWLAPDTLRADLEGLLGPCPDRELVAHPVSTRVNRPEHDDPACLEPVDVPPGGRQGRLFAD